MAMQDCGMLLPERVQEEQDFDGEEDVRGVEDFLAWCTGEGNAEIRRVAMEGGKEDYLTGTFVTAFRICLVDQLTSDPA